MGSNDNGELYSTKGTSIVHSDEIDLLEIWNNLVSEKMVVGLTTVGLILLSTIYAFSMKPIYKSEAYFFPVEKESIQGLVDWDLILDRQSSYTSLELFNIFKQNIMSRANLWTFFTKNKLYKVYDESLSGLEKIVTLKDRQKVQKAFDQFYQNFLVQESKENEIGQYLSVALEMALSEKDVQLLLSEYLVQVRNNTRHEILASITNEQKSRLLQAQKKIRSMKEIAEVQRSDRLAQLDEAISIARSLDLKEPPTIGAKATIQGVSNQGLPLYYLGYRLLEAERDALDDRKSNDPFINGLRAMQEKVALLSSYKLSMQDFAIVRLDQDANIGEKIKPNKVQIVAVSGVLGFILGVFIALIKVSVVRRKERN
ncbi:hypothetical protein CYQ88_02595 [Hydrogenovibrio sp. SC-1]|uniref:Wzz/FepE/Etk N-terminal domain-containing protein n=1 Tax=Hydrogenovibrio sp. SC-1 TaxID=2065820 RepID=UPI000C7E621A|nr:Wzz/FepE/Etk N-terminal domain-containing protein [Hydrogenovibrio sp. SC-1]PLA75134.1 hypothetical protein CYQ88_02595 [Hydrogenovibrio sp. SC-1]